MAGLFGIAPRAITLDDLIALNDEMISLVRAGVPLAQGLGELGGDFPGQLGVISTRLATRLERGESLEHVLGQTDFDFPPVYRAVVLAGVRAGRLPAALESVAASVRRLSELRRAVSLAMLYPLVIFLLTYGLFVFLVVNVIPVLVSYDWTNTTPTLVGWVNGLGDSVHVWGPVVPIVVIGLAAVWWQRSRRAALLQPGFGDRYLGWVPSLRSVFASSRAGAFCEVLSVLVAHGVPLAEALRLAAQSSGDARILGSAEEMAVRIEAGGKPDEELDQGRFSPLVNWLLLTRGSKGELVQSLRFAADSYQRRASRQAEWLGLYLPLILTAVIGGAVVFLYAMALFVPWSMMMSEIAAP
ncbi:MAG: type II secretion system F family protein [Pirellulales bacterium]